MTIRGLESLFLWDFFLFMYFVRKACVFSLLHAHFDVWRYLMILCHFDLMNDKIMFFSFY